MAGTSVFSIFAAIFIPLTFVAGVYGINFSPDESPFNMPELNFYLGYPMALFAMAVIGVIMEDFE
jgi:magnesium transporter